MNLAEHRHLRLFTFCALYCAQGIPWGFMAYTLPAYVAARGGDIGAVGGIAAMTTLPYTLKPVFGLVIDAFPSRRFGRRRPWIVFAQAMMVLTVGTMILVPDLTASVRLLAWMIFIHTIFNAMQDVGVDALAIDLLDEAERGRANGLMYGSKYLGGTLGGWGMAHLIDSFDLRIALTVQTSVLLAIMMLPVFVRERAGDTPARPPVVAAIKAWWRRVFGDRSMTVVIGGAARDRAVQTAVLGIVVMLGSTLGASMLSPVSNVLFTNELGWSAKDYTSLTSGPGLFVGLGGSILGGFLADKVGHRLLAAIGMIGLASGYVLWAVLEPYWSSHTLVYSTFWIEPLFQSIMTVSLFALCMDIAWPQIAAAQFAFYMAMINVSSTVGALISGYAAERLSYVGLYITGAVLQLAFILVLPMMDPKAARSPGRQTQPA